MYLEELEKESGPVDEILKEGRIKEITKWLNEKIHWYGSTRTPKEVIANVCGKKYQQSHWCVILKKNMPAFTI